MGRSALEPIAMESVNQEQIRCFVAIEIPEAIQTRLVSVQEELREHIRGASWVKRENIHLTLKFLGDVAPNQINIIKNTIEQVAGARSPFLMEIGGIGAFPNLVRPRIIWAGMKTGADEVTAIAREINSGLSRRGYARDEKKFRPHFTLARLKSRMNLKSLVHVFQLYDTMNGATLIVDRIRVVQSRLKPSGAVYTPLETCYFDSRSTSWRNSK